MLSPPAELRARLPELMLRDRRRLARRLDSAGRLPDPDARASALAGVAGAVAAAELRVEARRAGVPPVSYPEALPVSQRRDDILAALRDSQVVVVAGETGSGKTTQLPKMCLELGRGVRGLIGHTQPRRLAARAVADRVAEELGTPLGGAVGYKVRFTDSVGPDTLVKVMTDGILLAEIQSDPLLEQYDTLILDEAHERSLNVDFLLGYLKQLLPRRPDLKLIITSATIDPHRFARHFDDAPVIEVSGRTYPVEVRYRPLVPDNADGDSTDSGDGDGQDRDVISAIGDAVDELCAEGPGDVLVFLSGEREIRDTADALRRTVPDGTEILPLYARLSAAEQHRVFAPHPGRRIVLATNVAETSLTVPGIRYVVDPGTARVSRYSSRLKVQRLPIEPVSQASANQRAGRCGRVAEGVCIRLYAEEDFRSRPEFTDPEILRTNLASVILAMTALGLGDLAAFPFLDPPDRRHVRDGVALLEELHALDPAQPEPRKRLTPIGRQLAQLPVDPRLGRMVLEADRNGCLREVLVITAALSIQDPRERPLDRQQAAAEAHARFADKDSDFLALLNLWSYLQEQQRALSSSAFRRLCKREFLHHLRVREWQDLHAQLRSAAKSLGLALSSTPAQPGAVHVSLLAGLLSHVGMWDPDKREYLGARGARFALSPGSALAKKPPRWVMAAELVETTRLWARVNARIEPEEAERLGAHLVKRSYSEPHWEKKRGGVVAYERVTLYGVPLVASRKVDYGRIDPALSRELFLRHALVEGDWSTHHAFWHENQRLLAEAEQLEDRVRRRGLVVDEETLFEFYDARVGREVVSARHFDAWWKRTRRTAPDLLTFDRSMLLAASAGGVRESDYPEAWQQGDLRLRLSYLFEPGNPADGVTVDVPLPVLNRVRPAGFDWQVPGLREELVTELIRSLPKALRVSFVPAPDVARAALARMTPYAEPLLDALARELRRMTGVVVPPDAWQLDRVPPHLRMTFRVVDERDRTLAQGKDLGALQRQLAAPLRTALASAAGSIERSGLRAWDLGTLPRTFSQTLGGQVVQGYPALVDEGSSVAVRVLASEAEQQRAMWAGTRRLLLLNVPSPARKVQARLGNAAKLALGLNPHGSIAALLEDCVTCAADRLIADAGGPAYDEEGFGKLLDAVRTGLDETTFEVVTTVERVLTRAHRVRERLDSATSPVLAPAVSDLRSQLAGLVHPGFVTATGWRRLQDLPRYLAAMERRLDKLAQDPRRDLERLQRVQQVQAHHAQLLRELPPGSPAREDLRRARWLVEELRVSLFAQELGTPLPVSEKRVLRAMDALAA